MDRAKIEKLIKERKWNEIKNLVSKMHSTDAAEILEKLEPGARAVIFRSLPRKFAAKIFSYLDIKKQDALLHDLTNKEANVLLSDLSPDDRTELFEEIPSSIARRLFALLSPEDYEEVRQLLGYPDSSVGRKMTPDYLSVRPDWTVKQALDHIRKYGNEKETVDMVYMTDEHEILKGDFKLKHLIFEESSKKIKDIEGVKDLLVLSPFDDQEKAVEMIKKFNLVALPVVDSEGVMLGIVTVDDLIDVAEEEVTEDFHKIGGLSIEKGGLSLTHVAEASIQLLYRKRIAWLMVLVGMNIFSGAAIANYEDVITKSVSLIFFLPLLIGSGGNAGSQAATLMVRALGTGDVKISDWVRLLSKEFLVAGLLGVTMAIGVSLIGLVRGGYDIAVVTASAMFLIVLVGSTVGLSLPFIFTRFKRDPATASGPLITSIADICGVIIYFTIAKWYFGI